MADNLTPSQRSHTMRQVRQKDTSPELLLRKTLWFRGIRGWRCHRKDLPGSPDLTFGRGKLAVFVDGAFWHGHPSKYTPGQSGDFWDEKITTNVARDERVDTELLEMGWSVLRLWDFEIEKDPLAAANRVMAELSQLRNARSSDGR